LTLRARAERAEQAAVASWVPDETTVEAATSDDSAVVLRILTTLLDKMKMPAQIETLAPDALNGYEQGDGPTLAVNLRGLDLSNLIGRRGETLDSLQYLIRMLAAKELARYVNVVIDVEGYKAHRVQILQQLARRTAERVTTTHKPAALEPMPSNERRIVHLTLRDHPHVRTESVGNGENRKVTIIPRSYKR